MAVAGQDHELTVAGDRPHDLTRLHRQDLVPLAVEQQERSATEASGDLAPGGLGRERDDAGDELVQADRHAHCDGSAEAVPHDHDAVGARADDQLHGGGDIDAARIEVVGTAIGHAHHGHPTLGECSAEPVVQPVGRPEEAAHRAPAGDHGGRPRWQRFGRLVPQERQQPSHREELEVAQLRCDEHVLLGENLEGIERGRGSSVAAGAACAAGAGGASAGAAGPTSDLPHDRNGTAPDIHGNRLVSARRPTGMRTSLRRSLTALGAGVVLAGCSSSPSSVSGTDEPVTSVAQRPGTTVDAPGSTNPGTRPTGSGVGRGLAFRTFDNCDAFLGYVREHALDQVGAYGFGGGWFDRIMPGMAETTMAASAEEDNAGGAAPTASDQAVGADGGTSGTNTQEAGVDEGDLVETDGRYVYTIVDGRTLTIVDTIEGTKVGTLRLDPDQGMSQMILDGTRLALVVNGWGGGPVPLDSAGRPASDFGYGYGYGLTGVNVIDVADPTTPTSLGTSWFEGSAQAVRATDGVVRVVVTSGLGDRLPFVVPANGSLSGEERAEELNRQLVEESVAEDWLPRRIDESPGGTTSTPITTIGCDRIGQPDEFSGLGLTWIATVDLRADAPETLGSAGVVSTGGTTYASAEHLYVSTVRWDPPVDGVQPMRPEPPTTAIHSFGIAGRGDAAYEASGVIDGSLLNQFSMSEHEGRLRVATTTFDSGFGGSSESQVRVLERSDTSLEQVGVVSGLGVTEQIYSVRFIGNMAYVVTFRQMDPLYVVDLSDPTAPVGAGRAEDPGLLGLPAPGG